MSARPGALVLHGLTSTTQSVAGLAATLEAAGFDVEAPMLPGHGTVPEDLTACGWDDWRATAERAFAALVQRGSDRVTAVGLSMGGALAASVAASHPDVVTGLVAVNPMIDPPAPSFQALLGELLATGEEFLPGIGGDVSDPDSVEIDYDRLPVAALRSMGEGLHELRPRLGDIRCPVLIVTSRNDHVVPIVSSDVLAGAVAGPVERVWLERSFHVATLDVERDEVERRTVAFALRVGAVQGPTMTFVAGISRDDVLHVARLARLDLTEEELDRFTEQLGAVVDHVADLQMLNTAGVPPTAHPLPLANVLRPDVPGPSLDRDEVLSQAPAAEAGRFRVPRILGEAP